MGYKIYKPDKEVCFYCGKYFPKYKGLYRMTITLGKIFVCDNCSKINHKNDIL